MPAPPTYYERTRDPHDSEYVQVFSTTTTLRYRYYSNLLLLLLLYVCVNARPAALREPGEREKMNTARRRQLFFFDVLQLRRRRRHLLLRTLLHPTISLKSFPVKGERIGIGISSSLLMKQAARSFFLRRGAGFSFFS